MPTVETTATRSPDPAPRWPDTLIAAAAAAGHKPADVLHTMSQEPTPAAAAALLGLTQPPTLPDDAFILVLGDPDYPQQLAAAANPPKILFGRGNPDLLNRSGVAVTGTRNPSAYGSAVAAAAASAIGHAGTTLICGAAAGCDHLAAATAVQYNTPVIAVLATGPDVYLDATQAALVDDVVKFGGAVISEHPFGTGTDTAPGYTPAPLRARLAARNRIIVGLAALVLPISGTFHSGTAGAVWTALAERRPLIVARPRPHAAHLSDTQLPLALAHPVRPGVAQLRSAGCPASVARKLTDNASQARAADDDHLAHAVATDPDQLSALVTTMWQLSPFNTPHQRS